MRDNANPLVSNNTWSMYNSRMRKNEVKILKGISLLSVLRSMVNGFIIAVIPKMSNTLQMLEPTTFPSDISPCP